MSNKFLLQFQQSIKVLEAFGLWQSELLPIHYRVLSYLVKLFLLEVPTTLTIINLMLMQTFDEEAFAIFFLFFIPSIVVNHFLWNIKGIKKLYTEFQNLLEFTEWSTSADRIEFEDESKSMTRFFKILLTFIAMSIITDLNVPVFESRLPYQMWIPYDYHCNEFVFYLTSIIQIVVTVQIAFIFISIYLFPIFAMGVVVKILKEFSQRLEHLSRNGGETEENLKELVRCVKVQIEIKSFVKNIESCFSTMYFFYGFNVSVFVCLMAHIVSSVKIQVFCFLNLVK